MQATIHNEFLTLTVDTQVERILRRCHPAVQRGCRRENFER